MLSTKISINAQQLVATHLNRNVAFHLEQEKTLNTKEIGAFIDHKYKVK